MVAANDRLESQMSEIAQENSAFISKIGELETTLASLEQKISDIETEKWELEETIETARENLETANADLQRLKTENKTLLEKTGNIFNNCIVA